MAAPHTPLPDPKDVAELLTSLVGKPVQVTKSKLKMKLKPKQSACVAFFDVDHDDATKAPVCVADVAAASYLGAALALIPKGQAEAAVKAGKLDAALGENFAEVMNVFTVLLNDVGPHTRFRSVQMPPDPIARELRVGLLKAKRVDLDVDIPGYGRGRLVLAYA